MNLESLAQLLADKPLAGIAAAELLAIVTLFWLLVRSYSKRIDSAELQATALAKMQVLHERTVEVLEDVKVIQQTRARRRQLKSASGDGL